MKSYSMKEFTGLNYILNIYEKDKPIVFLIHGFLGNISERPISSLINLFRNEKISFFAFDFKGHGESIGAYPNFSEQFDQLKYIFEIIKQKISNSKFIFASHSIGCSLLSRLIIENETLNNENNLIIFLAPSLDPNSFINRVFTEDEIIDILNKKFTSKDFGKKGKKKIDLDWIDSYRNFFKNSSLQKIKSRVHAIFPEKDQKLGLSQLDLVKENFRNVEIYKISDAGHSFYEFDQVKLILLKILDYE